MLVGILAGGSPAGGTCPVASVVISGGGAGDQSVGSPDVKSPRRLGEGLVSSDRRASVPERQHLSDFAHGQTFLGHSAPPLAQRARVLTCDPATSISSRFLPAGPCGSNIHITGILIHIRGIRIHILPES
jgi:hypothetical protein